jgi:hypothetical protein
VGFLQRSEVEYGSSRKPVLIVIEAKYYNGIGAAEGAPGRPRNRTTS